MASVERTNCHDYITSTRPHFSTYTNCGDSPKTRHKEHLQCHVEANYQWTCLLGQDAGTRILEFDRKVEDELAMDNQRVELPFLRPMLHWKILSSDPNAKYSLR